LHPIHAQNPVFWQKTGFCSRSKPGGDAVHPSVSTDFHLHQPGVSTPGGSGGALLRLRIALSSG
jgi:hypothetical protein